MRPGSNAEEKKQLRYVAACEQIRQMIRQGELKPGDRLPSEHELSQRLGVSRGTLRQALALLREGGLIYQHQGKGNFLRQELERAGTGLEKVHNSMVQYATVPIESRTLTVEYFPSTDTVQAYLEREETTLLAQFHVRLWAKETVVAYRLYFIPYESLERYQVNLDDEAEMLAYLDLFLSETVVSSNLAIDCVEAREAVAKQMERRVGTPLLCLAEVMRRKDGKPALYVKGHYDPNYFQFYINRE